ncbi:MAG: hypothetical protein EKK49_18280 [Rhodocyclaceae bacterium]|nr:MAG: hypothetical protein EKK49_18280 [Rhodocyclaceae bacterium]
MIAVTLGRNGMAWGRGLHPAVDGTGKCEGDGRAPAGVFAITGLFGYAAAGDGWTAGLRLPYFAARPGLKCVDDPASAHYTCLVDQSAVAADWASCEDMLRQDRRYEAGAVVAHNTAPSSPTTPLRRCRGPGRASSCTCGSRRIRRRRAAPR